MSERVPRLGDVVDDYCPRCRLLLNHDIASLAKVRAADAPADSTELVATIAKVTCRTCHNTHDYRHAEVPPKRKTKQNDKKKLMDEVLAGIGRPPAATPEAAAPQPAAAAGPEAAPNRTPGERKKRDLWAEYQRIQSKDKKD